MNYISQISISDSEYLVKDSEARNGVGLNQKEIRLLQDSGYQFVPVDFVAGDDDGKAQLPSDAPYGTVNKYRIYSIEKYKYAGPASFTIADGFRAYFHVYSDETTYKSYGWITGSATYEDATYGIYICIGRTDSSVAVSDVSELSQALTMKSNAQQQIENSLSAKQPMLTDDDKDEIASRKMVVLTQDEYDALETKDDSTLYIIKEETS